MRIEMKTFCRKVKDIETMKLALFVDKDAEKVFIIKTTNKQYPYIIMGSYSNTKEGVCVTHSTSIDDYLFVGYICSLDFVNVEVEEE